MRSLLIALVIYLLFRFIFRLRNYYKIFVNNQAFRHQKENTPKGTKIIRNKVDKATLDTSSAETISFEEIKNDEE